jgi:two-component system, chemotaxis family, sensor kinase CheA
VTRMPDERMAELRGIFFDSAHELLQAMNDEALRLEKHPEDAETLRALRRAVHTLKGDAAACGFNELSELAHEFEDRLAFEGGVGEASSVAETAFVAADTFSEMLEAYRHDAKLPSTEPLRTLLHALAAPTPKQKKSGPTKASHKSDEVPAWSEYEQLAITNAQARNLRVLRIVLELEPACAMPDAALQMVRTVVSALGEVLALTPQDSNKLANSRRIETAVACDKAISTVSARCKIPGIIARATVTNLATAPASSTRSDVLHQDAHSETPHDRVDEPENWNLKSAGENILRVEAERIDNVLNLAGELVIGRSMFQQAVQEFARRFPKDPLHAKLADALAFQTRIMNDLQRSVMKIRMVPVEQLFRRFPRIVRDVARQCGKEVELVVSGQDTDLDKGILDSLAEPMTHLVRNAISHGIEEAEVRHNSGKPAKGVIRLNAFHQGNQVVIEISDDGNGLDIEKIRSRAVELGLVEAMHAPSLGHAEVLDLIYQPGFSTADRITEIAGRGVGMDVVHSVVQRLKGIIETETRAGQGTTFRIKLPLTLAIIKAVLFRVQHRTYAVPMDAVLEMTRATESDVHRVDNHELLQLRKQTLPLLRLGVPGGNVPSRRVPRLFVIVVKIGDRKVGLAVDSLVGEEELVIKSLDTQVVSSELISGASILGDGRVVLILNVPALLECVGRSRPQDAGEVSYGLLLPQAEIEGMRDSAKTRGAAGGQS